MRTRSVCRRALLLSCGFQVAAARLLHSLPEDTYAFPKYRVSFLNGLPVLKDTADRWLKEGLRGGESEFLDQPWKDGGAHSSSELKGIGNGDNQEPGQVSTLTPIITIYSRVHIIPSQIFRNHPMSLWNT